MRITQYLRHLTMGNGIEIGESHQAMPVPQTAARVESAEVTPRLVNMSCGERAIREMNRARRTNLKGHHKRTVIKLNLRLMENKILRRIHP